MPTMGGSAQIIHKNSSDERQLPLHAVAPSSEEGVKLEADQNVDTGEGRVVLGFVLDVD